MPTTPKTIGTSAVQLVESRKDRTVLEIVNLSDTATVYISDTEKDTLTTNKGLPIPPNSSRIIQLADLDFGVMHEWYGISDTANTNIIIYEAYIEEVG